jgi:REP element-mobilizing transposase RayT
MASEKRARVPGSLSYATCWGTPLRPLFRDSCDYSHYLRLLRKHAKRHRVSVHAYCLLPEEAHLLLETADSDVSRPMQSLNTSYALYSNRRHAHAGHVFARPYTLVLVEKNLFMLEATRRIHLLPAVVGLVDDATTYPWSSIRAYLGLHQDPVAQTSEAFRFLSAGGDPYASYARYLAAPGAPAWSPQGRGDKAVGSSAFQELAEREAAFPLLARPPVRQVADKAAHHYGMSLDALLNGRSRDQVWCRQVFMYVATTYGGYSLHELGRLCGGRSPSTVHHAVQRVAAAAAGSREARDVRGLAEALFPSSMIGRMS